MIEESVADKLKLEHGEDNLRKFDVGQTTLVFRRPKRAEFDLWYDNREKGTVAARQLAQSTLIHPGPESLKGALDELPGLLMGRGGVLDALTEMAGFGGDVAAKKL